MAKGGGEDARTQADRCGPFGRQREHHPYVGAFVRCVEQPRPVVAELFGGRDVPRGVQRGRDPAEILIVAGTASGPGREGGAEHG